jgi:hypothetical protein
MSENTPQTKSPLRKNLGWSLLIPVAMNVFEVSTSLLLPVLGTAALPVAGALALGLVGYAGYKVYDNYKEAGNTPLKAFGKTAATLTAATALTYFSFIAAQNMANGAFMSGGSNLTPVIEALKSPVLLAIVTGVGAVGATAIAAIGAGISKVKDRITGAAATQVESTRPVSIYAAKAVGTAPSLAPAQSFVDRLAAQAKPTERTGPS